jgi:hypothetical protein
MWVWNFGSDDLDALAAFATAEVVDTIFLSLPAAMRADLATGNVRTPIWLSSTLWSAAVVARVEITVG